jgi:nicotinamidase-related amidase
MRLRPDNSVLLVVDLQEKLLAAVHEADACVEMARRMIEAAKVLDVPMLCTEQYPKGIGRTCPPILEALAGAPLHEKLRFSACIDPVMRFLDDLKRRNVIVVGIEAHVCVQQTVLELLSLGYVPFVCADAVTSRRVIDRDTAIARMRQAGAIVTTTESVTFELLGEAGGERFKRILKIVK